MYRVIASALDFIRYPNTHTYSSIVEQKQANQDTV